MKPINFEHKINIAHVVYSFGTGGIENGIVNIVNNLDVQRYQHVICCLTQAGNFTKRLKTKNYLIYELNKNEGNDFHIIFKLKTIFKLLETDVIHLRGWPTLIEGLLGAKLAGVSKVIYGFHGKTASDIAGKNIKRKIAESLAITFVNKVVTLSDIMKKDYQKYTSVSERKIDVIHNGVDIEKFRFHHCCKAAREKFGFSEKDVVIGSVGRLDSVKDFITLLQAFALVGHFTRNAKLLIVGAGQEYQMLQTLAFDLKIHEDVIFTGHRDDIPALLQLMDIYVQTSLYEGFSNTIVEAMASGLPIIATNVGGNALLVSEGQNGFLVEPRSPEELRSKLAFLISEVNIRQMYAQSSRDIAMKNFSIAKMIDSYDSLYSRLTYTKS